MANTRAKNVLTVGILSGSKAVAFVTGLVTKLESAKKAGTEDAFTVGAVTGAALSTLVDQSWAARPVSMGVSGLTKALALLSIPKDVKACPVAELALGTFDTAESAIALLQTYGAVEIEAFVTGLRAVSEPSFTTLTNYAAARINSKLVWDKVA